MEMEIPSGAGTTQVQGQEDARYHGGVIGMKGQANRRALEYGGTRTDFYHRIEDLGLRGKEKVRSVASNIDGGGSFRGSSNGNRYGDSNGGNDDAVRGLGGYYCQEIVVIVDALGFSPAVMTKQISRRRQGLRRSEQDSGERTMLRHHRD